MTEGGDGSPAPPRTDVAAPVIRLLDQLAEVVSSARAMPMSASCVVNRAEVLTLVEDLRRALPRALAQASEVLAEREAVVEEGRAEATELVRKAREERKALVARTEVHKAAKAEAARIRAEAEEDADAMRLDAEHYVDRKLANFEVVLSKTLAAVHRGREALAGSTPHEALGLEDGAAEDPAQEDGAPPG